MRLEFVKTLLELAERDARILLLTGDLGFLVLEPFRDRFPERFFNVGVAEQNMVGLATGLAEDGYVPFIYSIATFATLRPFEFIRNGPVHHNLPVRIVGVGAGYDYGPAGPTHHALEDIGVMRTQPGLTVIAPADYRQTSAALRATKDVEGAVYYRIGKDDRTTIPGLDGRFELGRAQICREGTDLLFVVMGSIAKEAAEAADVLAEQGINSTIMVVASLNPPPVEDIADALSRFPVALTVEAHYTVGGVGSLVCEVAAERGLNCRVVRCGVKHAPQALTGSHDYLNKVHGLTSDALVETAWRALTIAEVAQ
ncbi:MAG TPA: transketolase C-terminal domain-containing protein [Pyrinomonadaceae bacterium]|jgi:transketolase